MRDGEVLEVHVAFTDDGAFIDALRPADAMLGSAVRHVERYLEAPFTEGYRSELLAQLPYWIQAIGGLLHEGAMLFADYGYPRGDYYLPEIGRASCRERVCQYVYISVVVVSLQKKQQYV